MRVDFFVVVCFHSQQMNCLQKSVRTCTMIQIINSRLVRSISLSSRNFTRSLRTRVFYPSTRRCFGSSSNKTDMELLKEADSMEHFCNVGSKFLGTEMSKMHKYSEDLGFESSPPNSFWLHVGEYSLIFSFFLIFCYSLLNTIDSNFTLNF